MIKTLWYLPDKYKNKKYIKRKKPIKKKYTLYKPEEWVGVILDKDKDEK